MLAFHLQKPRQGCAQTERLRIGGVDGADHWLGHTPQRLQAYPARHKARETLIVDSVRTLARQEQIRRHTRLAGDAKNVAGDKRPEPRRREQLKSFGHGTQPSVSHDETAPELFVGLDEARLES